MPAARMASGSMPWSQPAGPNRWVMCAMTWSCVNIFSLAPKLTVSLEEGAFLEASTDDEWIIVFFSMDVCRVPPPWYLLCINKLQELNLIMCEIMPSKCSFVEFVLLDLIVTCTLRLGFAFAT